MSQLTVYPGSQLVVDGWVDCVDTSPKTSVESKEEIEGIMSQKGFRNQDRVDKSGRSGGEDLGS